MQLSEVCTHSARSFHSVEPLHPKLFLPHAIALLEAGASTFHSIAFCTAGRKEVMSGSANTQAKSDRNPDWSDASTSIEQCRELCLSSPTCKAATWVPGKQLCFRYFDAIEFVTPDPANDLVGMTRINETTIGECRI